MTLPALILWQQRPYVFLYITRSMCAQEAADKFHWLFKTYDSTGLVSISCQFLFRVPLNIKSSHKQSRFCPLCSLFTRDGDSSLRLSLESHLSRTHRDLKTWLGLVLKRLKTWLGLVFWDSWTIIMVFYLGVLILSKLWNVKWDECDSFPFFHGTHGNHITHQVRASPLHALVPRMTTMVTGGTPAAAICDIWL